MERDADAAERAGADLRLRRLARSFGLDPYDVELLLIALAPDLDPRFERLYGYLHDDVSRRRASAGLALELCSSGASPGAGPGRARLGPLGALVAGGLIVVEDPDRPFLTRALRVPDRVAAHLLGDDTPDPAIEPLRVDAVAAEIGDVDILARAIAGNVPLIYLRERPGSSGHSLARAALDRLGRPVVELDLTRLGRGDEPRDDRRGGVPRGRPARRGPRRRADRAARRAGPGGRPRRRRVAARDRARRQPRLGPGLVAGAAARPRGAGRDGRRAPRDVALVARTAARPIGFDPAIVTLAFRLARARSGAPRRRPIGRRTRPTGR